MKEKNIYDYLIIIVITFLVFGSMGGALQPIRLLSIISIPFVILSFFKKNLALKTFGSYFFLLICYMILSLTWSIDIEEGIKVIIYNVLHIFLFLLLIIFYHRSNRKLESFFLGWLIFLSCTLVVALIEIFFNIHLSSSFFGSDNYVNIDGDVVLKKFAAVTFGNYNTYVTVLCMSLPFALNYYLINQKWKAKFLTLFAFLSSTIVVLTNASRGGVLAFSVISLFYIYYLHKSEIKISGLTKFLSVTILFVALYFYRDILFEQLSYRFASGRGMFEDNSRSNLMLHGLEIVNDYNFLGSGVGSINRLMELKRASISIPHNFFLEFLIEYGIFLLLPIIFFMIRICFLRFAKNLVKDKFFIGARIACYIFPVVSVINSGYVLQPVVWVFFATLSTVYLSKDLKIDRL